MPKDKDDTATIDMLNPNKHGGYRAGSGRKKGGAQKIKLGWAVTSDAKSNIEALAEDKNYSAAELLDYIMKKQKKAPDNLD